MCRGFFFYSFLNLNSSLLAVVMFDGEVLTQITSFVPTLRVLPYPVTLMDALQPTFLYHFCIEGEICDDSLIPSDIERQCLLGVLCALIKVVYVLEMLLKFMLNRQGESFRLHVYFLLCPDRLYSALSPFPFLPMRWKVYEYSMFCCGHGTESGSLFQLPWTFLLLSMPPSTTFVCGNLKEYGQDYSKLAQELTVMLPHHSVVGVLLHFWSISSGSVILYYPCHIHFPSMASNKCHDTTHVDRINSNTMSLPFELLEYGAVEVDSLLKGCSILMLCL